MPIHDWTRVDAGIFHAFHHGWIEELVRALNRGVLPSDYYALPEQLPAQHGSDADRLEKLWTITVREQTDRAVAIVKIVTPGERASRTAISRLTERITKVLVDGIHVLIIDITGVPSRYPLSIHDEVWRQVADERFSAPVDKPLLLAAYRAGKDVEAYVDPVAVGDSLGDMPLFLSREGYATAPLEPTYNAAFAEVPRRWRRVLDSAAP